MDDTLMEIAFRPRPTAQRPLLGLTVLVVEDSRYASEAMRLLCQRSGARIRRADCMASAERHLSVYRPAVAIVDLGLPDGSGLDLIARMHAMTPRVPIILGTSGAEREAARAASMDAGAEGFLPKPIESLAGFQQLILSHLPADLRPCMPRLMVEGLVEPDLIALREDLTHAIALLALEEPPTAYLKRFLLGLARSAQDRALEGQAQDMGARLAQDDCRALSAFLSQRVQALPIAI
jgi:CheY-like chemotaxis protein